MKVGVVGTGYVGLVVGACLAETGNDVTCVDVDQKKIDGLKKNILPIFEPGLQDIVERTQREGRLVFSTDIVKAVVDTQVVFIAVGTPPDEDGSADLGHVLAVAEQIGKHANTEIVVVTKSTVPVGTAHKVWNAIDKHAKVPFHVCSNPEFLKEGAAVDDFLKPDRVVIGTSTVFSRQVMGELYAPFVRTGKPIIYMDIASAELTKYAANAMLATRISFMNEIANFCERVGADVDLVRKGIGSDARIGPSFLFPGPGYGGSCFPKDVQALLRTADQIGIPLHLVAAAEQANNRQKQILFQKVSAALGGNVSGARVALWGLAFKPNTDDMREAPALTLIDQLLDAGATVAAHDPAAAEEARRRLGDKVTLVDNMYEALTGADALVVVTDWNAYRNPDFARLKQALKRAIIVDGRNLYNGARLRESGFIYDCIGRSREAERVRQ
ncbi:MAG TPA: UDP-glucose/GDP-mannose dehydrogenase family protein [Gemmatimonadaceae bacterium]|nr:UDP-glucose/GDP-mannose dehydrogenase family protein [Gemmatimonadaceae bacterium]